MRSLSHILRSFTSKFYNLPNKNMCFKCNILTERLCWGGGDGHKIPKKWEVYLQQHWCAHVTMNSNLPTNLLILYSLTLYDIFIRASLPVGWWCYTLEHNLYTDDSNYDFTIMPCIYPTLLYAGILSCCILA